MKKMLDLTFVAVLLAIAQLISCSNGNDTPLTNGWFTTTTGTTTPPQTDGDQTTNPTGTESQPTSVTYTITFNANDESQNPATATQIFSAGIPQNLKTISTLGFARNGFYFAGWLTTANDTEACYADGAAYTAVEDTTLYAKWSEIPVYSVKTPTNEHGNIIASPATATAGTEIMLTVTPNTGYEVTSYSVTDSVGITIPVTNGKFIMPETDVNINATFTAIEYMITCGPFEYGSITTSATTAILGTEITLTIIPAIGYRLNTISVVAADNSSVNTTSNENTRLFTMSSQNVIVSASFTKLPSNVEASGAYKEIGTKVINGTSYKIVTFGLWPQTIKSPNIMVNETENKKIGDFTYCRGSDGEWYVKAKEQGNRYYSDNKYTDGTSVNKDSANSYKWFKVEPIKWRIIDKSFYNYNDNKNQRLLLSEKILTTCEYYDTYNSKRSYKANNYMQSKIRAYLNGTSYDNENSIDTTFESKGFLYTAFTESERQSIATTYVSNDGSSMRGSSEGFPPGVSGDMTYCCNFSACESTKDKIFLLSQYELTNTKYGFAAYDNKNPFRNEDSERVRQETDYNRANGCAPGFYWTRSPMYGRDDTARLIWPEGSCIPQGETVSISFYGVVPALCLE